MVDYNIEVEIDETERIIKVDSFSGEYLYDLDSIEGQELLNRIMGTDVQITVYRQG
jgi:hypothetical protein